MNTLSKEICAFSGKGPIASARPGSGPSFAEWWQVTYDDFDFYEGYAPRSYYGEYLEFVYKSIVKNLPNSVALTPIVDCAVDIETTTTSCLVETHHHGKIKCDFVVVATGHSVNSYHGQLKELEDFALSNPAVNFIAADSSSCLDLCAIASEERVGILGLGLAFFDVIMELTVGRGGRFDEGENGWFHYLPSGQEPKLFCGSRSGLPILARGRNEKKVDYKHQHVILTKESVKQLRMQHGNDISFTKHIWPLLEAEVNLVYFKSLIENAYGREEALHYQAEVESGKDVCASDLAKLASRALAKEVKALNLMTLARPFDGYSYKDIGDWEAALIAVLEEDVLAASKGNISSPVKAALDVLRHSRDNIRAAVDFGGISPCSHQDFLYNYVPVINLLSAGPPLFRIKQLLALIKTNIVSIVPPDMCVEKGDTCYHITSGAVKCYQKVVTTLIDARVPIMNIHYDKNPLIRNLVKRGTFSSFINKGLGNDEFDTGGVNVTRSPFNPINNHGSVIRNISVLGIPTEHTRWFMQSGSSRPTHWIDFMIDADDIARNALTERENIG